MQKQMLESKRIAGQPIDLLRIELVGRVLQTITITMTVMVFECQSTATTDDFPDIVHFMHIAVQPLLLPVCLLLLFCNGFTHATDTIQGWIQLSCNEVTCLFQIRSLIRDQLPLCGKWFILSSGRIDVWRYHYAACEWRTIARTATEH